MDATGAAETPEPAAAAPLPATGELRFAILGDRTGSAVPGVYESIADQVADFGPAFVLTVGDHIEGYTEDPAELAREWSEYQDIRERLHAPFFPCPGNHDLTTRGMLAAWKEATGREPCYSFDEDGIHFIILDASRWESSEQWLRESGYSEWLRRDLESNSGARFTVVVLHKAVLVSHPGRGEARPAA